MSLEDIRSECSDTARMLQPYIDNELAHDEQERVADHLDDCRPCRTAVHEQLWVREVLQSNTPQETPRLLQAKISTALDLEDRPSSTRANWWANVRRRVRYLVRGGLVMVPAGVVAGALFLWFDADLRVDPSDSEPANAISLWGASLPSGSAPTTPQGQELTQQLAEIRSRAPFAVQTPLGNAPNVQLVGARLDQTDGTSMAARLRYHVAGHARERGQFVVDMQYPAHQVALQGQPLMHRGQQYLVGRAESGQPALLFEHDGITHMLYVEGERDLTSPDFIVLLDLAEWMGQTIPRNH